MTLADAVLAQVAAVLPAGVALFDAGVPGSPPARYVVVYTSTGRRSALGADAVSRSQSYTVRATSVAGWPDASVSARPECEALAGVVRDALTDWTPQVPGLAFGQVVHVNNREPIVDETIADRHVVYAVDEFTTMADRIS